MAHLIFDEDTMSKVKNRTGIYRHVEKLVVTSQFMTVFRTNLIKLIESSFKEYANKHKGITESEVNKYWNDFKKILDKNL